MVQRYNPDYVMHAARFAPFARENEHGEFVKFSDYEVLKAERDTLADRVERLSGMLTESRVATKSADERADALAVENAAMRAAIDDIAATLETGTDGMLFTAVENAVNLEVTQTDAALAAIRKESHIAGIQAAADRIGVISLKYKPGQKQELIKAIGRAVFQYANELREAK